MPAIRVGSRRIDVTLHDAIGEDGSDQRFVVHLALASEAVYGVLPQQEVRVHHVAPPAEGTMAVDVVGSAGLTHDDAKAIEDFLNRHLLEVQAEAMRDRFSRYVLCPHVAPVFGDDGEVIYVRFNCAGFVVEAYKEAGIQLVDTDALPRIERDRLAIAYSVVRSPRFEKLNRQYGWGLDDREDRWPVLMPGYVLHAFDRTCEEIRSTPYRPQLGDEVFPR